MEVLEDDCIVRKVPTSDSSPNKSDNLEDYGDLNTNLESILPQEFQKETYPTKEQIALEQMMEQEEKAILQDI